MQNNFLLVYVMWGLLAIAIAAIPYRIVQRARDNEMLRSELAKQRVELPAVVLGYEEHSSSYSANEQEPKSQIARRSGALSSIEVAGDPEMRIDADSDGLAEPRVLQDVNTVSAAEKDVPASWLRLLQATTAYDALIVQAHRKNLLISIDRFDSARLEAYLIRSSGGNLDARFWAPAPRQEDWFVMREKPDQKRNPASLITLRGASYADLIDAT